MLTDKKISAVIACYRDEESLPILYQRLTAVLKDITPRHEIVFVNGGSVDNAEVFLRDIARKDPHVVVVNHSRNFTSQGSFSSGMEVATGDAVVLLDADLQDPPELIQKFVEKWKEGYEVIYGVRSKREGPLFFSLATKIFYWTFRKLSYVDIPLDAGDFSLMDRRVVNILNAMPERDRFIRGLRAWVGFKQTGIPFHRPERMFGKSTNNFLKNIQWAKKGFFSFSYKPLEWISYLGFAIVVVSIAAIIFYLVSYFIFPSQAGTRGIQTIIVLILFMGGIQLLSLSIIGEYVGRIFEEVKQRPKFIVKDIINDPRKEKPSV